MFPSADVAELVTELIDAFVAGGGKKPVMPPGRRDDVIALLTRLMANEELRAAYCEALDAELEERDARRALLHLPGEEIPDAEIAANGFVNLSPDQLADFALSSAALEAIAEQLYCNPDLQPGDWLAQAVLLDMRAGGTAPPGLEARDS